MYGLLFIFIICSAPLILSQETGIDLPLHYCHILSQPDYTLFELNTMQRDHTDSIIRLNDVEHLRVHFCKPLKGPCNGKQNYAVCLHSGDKEIGVGKEPPKVAIEHGKIVFRYTGDQCNKTHKYTAEFEMKCNFANKDKIPADLDVLYNRSNCDFQATIETAAACAGQRETACSLSDEWGAFYDLSPLMNLAYNYQIKINKALSIIFNVCHSLIYGKHSHKCSHWTMVCLVNETYPKEPSYVNLGDIKELDPRLAVGGGSIFFDIPSTTPCNVEDSDEKTMRTTIEFVCKEDARNKMPKYVSGLGTCHYMLRWETVLACSQDTLSRLSKVNQQPCKITNPKTNELIDLSVFENVTNTVQSENGASEYQFSLCSPLQNSRCNKSGTGVCKYRKDKKMSFSKGLSNPNVTWDDDKMMLNYTDGMACGNNQRSYTTIILKCSYDTDGKIVEELDSCGSFIVWMSRKFCSTVCATPEHHHFLNRLGLTTTNFVARGENNSTLYYMNVCKPLLDDDFTKCTDGTGFCRVKLDKHGNRMSETNLGYIDAGLKTAEDGRVYMRYVNGSVCNEDTSRNISTEITFTCDSVTNTAKYLFVGMITTSELCEVYPQYKALIRGSPKFKGYSNCEYNFDWSTTYLCEEPDYGALLYCFLHEDVHIFDLSVLTKETLIEFTRKELDEDFTIYLSGNETECRGTFICDKENFYENGFKVNSNGSQKIATFSFRNEAECRKSSLYNSMLKLWCDMWDGTADLFLIKEGDCNKDLESVKTQINNINNRLNSVAEKVVESENSNATPIIVIMSVLVGFVVLALTIYFYRYGYSRAAFTEFRSWVSSKFRRRPE